MTVTVKGRVVKGRGQGKVVVENLADPIAAHLGAEPYFGTLNILLTRPLLLRPETAMLCDGVRAFWPVTAMGMPMLALRWTRCPYHALELVAAESLRERFGWTDGQKVELAFAARDVGTLSFRARLAWTLLWRMHPTGVYDRHMPAVHHANPRAVQLTLQPIPPGGPEDAET